MLSPPLFGDTDMCPPAIKSVISIQRKLLVLLGHFRNVSALVAAYYDALASMNA